MSVVSDNGTSVNEDKVEVPIIDSHVFATDTKLGPDEPDSLINQNNVDLYIDYAVKKLLSENIQRKKKSQLVLITRITPFIEKYGVKSDHLGILLYLILSEPLGARTPKLVPLLLPRATVSQKDVIRIFGNLSNREYSPKLMESLLHWVVCVYDHIDGKEHITKLYGVLFHYLTLERFRPQICHILFLMTKKVHVKPYRARFLVNLIEKVHPEPQLIALYKAFQSYQPSIKMGSEYTALRVNPFHDAAYPKFESKINIIRKLWINETTPSATLPNTNTRRSPEYRQESPVPEIATKKQDRKRVDVYKGIKFLKEDNLTVFDPSILLGHLNQQTIPEQILSILDNRMMQHVLVCDTNDTVMPRICDVLAQQLMDLLYWGRQTTESDGLLKNLLYKILQLARFAKAHIPVIETFLERYLQSWNGIDFTEEIFELLTYIKPNSYQVLFECYLKPLYQLYCVSDVRWKAKLILCYKDWLKNWALLDWYRHAERRNNLQGEDVGDAVDSIVWLFQGLSFNIDYFTVMQQLIYHVDRLCVQGLVMEEDHPILQHASLSFFEFTASMSLQHDIPSIVIPAASLVYRSFFSPNAMVVSRICGILHKYKLSFENNDRQAEDWMDKHSEEYLGHFNAYVLDICNCLWRNLAFDFIEGATSAFSLTSDIINSFKEKCDERGDALHLLFSLTHSSAFVGYSKQYMKIKTEELGLPNQHCDLITVESVKTLINTDGTPMSYMDYRVDYLEYLYDLGFHGVHDLLYTCMASLIKRREQDRQELDEQQS
ncbi:Mis6-domain-containing protein [Chlamydoabsidia padenii]|nr:Mis6-domain-containing protein [Chlamydoabsidia padenii]